MQEINRKNTIEQQHTSVFLVISSIKFFTDERVSVDCVHLQFSACGDVSFQEYSSLPAAVTINRPLQLIPDELILNK
jgi:hypothetical protein